MVQCGQNRLNLHKTAERAGGRICYMSTIWCWLTNRCEWMKCPRGQRKQYIYNYDYAYSVWHVLCCPFSVWLGRGSLQMTCSFTSSPLCFSFSSPCKCLCQTFGLWQSFVSTSMFCVCSDYKVEHISPQL